MACLAHGLRGTSSQVGGCALHQNMMDSFNTTHAMVPVGMSNGEVCKLNTSTEHSIGMADLNIRHGRPIKKEGCCICFCHYAQVHHQVLQGIVNTSHLVLMHCYRSTRSIQLAKYVVVHESRALPCFARYSAATDAHLTMLSGSMQAFEWCAIDCRCNWLMRHRSGHTHRSFSRYTVERADTVTSE